MPDHPDLDAESHEQSQSQQQHQQQQQESDLAHPPRHEVQEVQEEAHGLIHQPPSVNEAADDPPPTHPEATHDEQQERQQHQHQQHQQAALWGVPDQLAKILEAARGATNSAKTQIANHDAHLTVEEQQSMYEQARQVFAQMPHPSGDTSHGLNQYADRDGDFDEQNGSALQGESTLSSSLDGHHPLRPLHARSDNISHSPASPVNQNQAPYTLQPKAATAAAVTVMGGQVQNDNADVIAHHAPTYTSPEAQGHMDEVVDEADAHASIPSGRDRSKSARLTALAPGETAETERQRKDLHKEVERKRRAGINQAINELQSLVPECDEKGVNKGDIILRAAAYIRELKNSEASNIEKWTLEKLLMDQALHDGQLQLEATRAEVERLREALGKEGESIPRAEGVASEWEPQEHIPAPSHHQQQQQEVISHDLPLQHEVEDAHHVSPSVDVDVGYEGGLGEASYVTANDGRLDDARLESGERKRLAATDVFEPRATKTRRGSSSHADQAALDQEIEK